MVQSPQQPYSGIDHLEVMADAKNYNRHLARLVTADAATGSALVDFGAGDGTLATLIADSGFDVTCIEPDALLTEKLRDKGLQSHASIDTLGQDSVDYLYSFNVLEHISDDHAACCQLLNCLRPGGRLMIYVPAFQILYSSMDRKVGHYRRYTRASLAQTLRSAGFSVERTLYVDSLGYLASLAFKVFGSDAGDISRAAVAAYDRWLFPASRVVDSVARVAFGKNVVAYATKPILER
jgi:SAM-dependent methyltransferase